MGVCRKEESCCCRGILNSRGWLGVKHCNCVNGERKCCVNGEGVNREEECGVNGKE